MSGYIGPLPVPQGIQRKQSFTATAGQTTFNTNGYTDGNFITVYLNGVRLINGTDYTATNGSDVVLASAAAASDVLDFETFQTFSLVDQTFDNVTLKNSTHEDTDGGRESAVTFKGEQSGGEISTLAAIQASHDGTADDQKGDLIFKTNDGSDNAAPTEAARIDSGQALLVGKTDVTNATTTAGHQLESSGRVYHVRDGGAALQVGRKTSDGNIAAFYKDGTSVGSIGTNTNGNFQLYGAASSHVGIQFGSPSILPVDNSGASDDDAVDLGDSNTRFKDLYLSGGVVFDAVAGNATSNTLDDYEEGTFTPTPVTGTLTFNRATYVKIGRIVTLTVENLNLSDFTSGGAIKIQGLPFAPNSSLSGGVGSVMASYRDDTTAVTAYIPSNTSEVRFYHTSVTSGFSALAHNVFNNSLSAMYFQISYEV